MKNPFKLALIPLLSLVLGYPIFGDASSTVFNEAKADNTYESITLSDCYYSGESDYQNAANGTGLSVDNNLNHWGKYDWTLNQNTIDLHFNAIVGTAESEFYVYLANKQNEGGCIFLIQFQAAGLMTYAYSSLATFQNAFRWDSLGFSGESNEFYIHLTSVFDAENNMVNASIEAINLTRNSTNVKTRTVSNISLPIDFDTSYTFVRLFRRGSIHDITLYDHWNKITFVDDNSSNVRKVDRNSQIGTLPTPAGIEGGNFIGWFDEDDNEVTSSTISVRSMTVTAKYEKTYYRITFNDNDTLTQRDINIGDPIGELPTPQGKDGYLFEKWVDSKGNEITSSYIPTSDTTIYAKYLPKISNERVTLKDLDISTISHYNYQDDGFEFQSATNYIGQYNLQNNNNKLDLSFELEADNTIGADGNQIILRCFENIETKPNASGFRIYLRFKPLSNNLFIQLDDISNPDTTARFLGAYNGDYTFIDKMFYTIRVVFGFNQGNESCYIQIYVEDHLFINADSFVPNVSYLDDTVIRFGDCYGRPKVKDAFNTITLIDRVNNTENKYNGYYGLANPDIPSDVIAPSDKVGYVFSGWFNNDEEIDNQTPYSGNKTYIAKWLNDFDKKGPTIIDDDLKFETGSFNNFDYNSLVSDECGSYDILKLEFSSGCFDEYDCFIEGHHTLTIEAIDIFFNKTTATINIIVANKYTVRFISEGKVVFLTRLYEGELPTYGGETPYKANDAYNSYTFAGWDKEITPVTADVDYVAKFTAIPLEEDEKQQEEDVAEPKANVTNIVIIATSGAIAGISVIGLVIFIIIKNKKKK